MSRFAQYYAKYKHDAGCYDWEQRQSAFGALFENDESIEFYMGEAETRKVYKHRVYHLNTAPGIIVMRFANDIDIPVERDFEPAMAKDEPSCFVSLIIATICGRWPFRSVRKRLVILGRWQ